MAAGVAHEINNPISFVSSNFTTLAQYIEVFQRLTDTLPALLNAGADSEELDVARKKIAELSDEEDLTIILEDIGDLLNESTSGLERVRDIVQGLKSFARVDEAEVQEVDLNECLESTLKMAWNEIKYRCDVKKSLSPLPLVKCHPGQMNQVFLNLIINASQAVEDNGTVHLETSVGEDQKHVFVSVKDDGHGIAQENLTKLFTPFFTTKAVGEGTGTGFVDLTRNCRETPRIDSSRQHARRRYHFQSSTTG